MNNDENILGTYTMITSNKKKGVIARMAKLREQKKIVKLIYDCPEEHRKYSRGVRKRSIIKHFMETPIFKEDGKKIGELSHHEKEKRKRDIETLIKSCEPHQSNFIRPDIEIREELNPNFRSGTMPLIGQKEEKMMVKNSYDEGYYATGRGTDLLNPIGFTTILLGKHTTLVNLLITIFASSVVTTLFFVVLDKVHK